MTNTTTPGAAAPTFLPASACKFRDQPDPCAWPMCDCTQVGLRACERLLELGWWEPATVADLTEELTEARAQVSRLEEKLYRAIGQAGDNGCTANHWARQCELKDERIAKLEEALRPFAAVADAWTADWMDRTPLRITLASDRPPQVTLGDLRRVRNTLKEIGDE